MKIDDPKVQKFIAGQMSPLEEIEFRVALADHPEVADLAETLKRTARLIEQDKRTGEKPYGLDLQNAAPLSHKRTVAEAEEVEVPKGGLPLFFHKIMGNSWRLGVTISSVTLASLFLLLVVVPMLQSALKVEDGSVTETEFQKMIEDSERAKKREFMGESQNIPMHGRVDAGQRQKPPDIKAAFQFLLDPSNQILSAQSVENLSDMAKASSGAGQSTDDVSLPLAYETDIARGVTQSIVERRSVDLQQVQPDAWVNSYFEKTSTLKEKVIDLNYRMEVAPWNPEEYLLMFEISTPQKLDLARLPVLNVWVYQSQGAGVDSLPDLASFFSGTKPVLQYLNPEFSSRVLEALERTQKQSGGAAPWLVVAMDELQAPEAEYLVQKLELFPSLQLHYVAAHPTFSESSRRVRNYLLAKSTRGHFLHAPTPTLLRKALQTLQESQPQLLTEVKLAWRPSTNHWKSSEVIGQLAVGAPPISGRGWLSAGEKLVSFVRLKPLEGAAIEGDYGQVTIQYRGGEGGHSAEQKSEFITRVGDSTSLVAEPEYRFAAQVIWLGLGLKTEISTPPNWLTQLSSENQKLTLPPQLQSAQNSFQKLLRALE